MKLYTALFLLIFNMVVLSSCGAVETIFKAGMWWNEMENMTCDEADDEARNNHRQDEG